MAVQYKKTEYIFNENNYLNMNDANYIIKEVKKDEKGALFDIEVILPMSAGWIDNVMFCTKGYPNDDYHQMFFNRNDKYHAYFNGNIYLETSALYKTYFKFNINGITHYLDKNKKILKNIDYKNMDKLSSNFDTPNWAKGAMMYHIFIDRFNRGSKEKMKPIKGRRIMDWNEPLVSGPDEFGTWNNDFYGGDLKGIIDKLPYIKSLGTDIIYLSPIVESQSTHRYDTADYENIDPYIGKNDDLKLLCDEAHKKGMKVILDAVFNHTGNDSKYFNEYGRYKTEGAFQNKDSYYGSFYKKVGSSFCYWWSMPNMPVCDGQSENWRKYICGEGGVIDKWFKQGIDGLRLDVADELSDEYIELIRKAVHRNKKDGLILAEVWHNAMKMGRGYLGSGKGFDSQMDYPLVDVLIRYIKYNDVNKLRNVLEDFINNYPNSSLYTLMNFTSTHDISRPINIFGTNEFRENTEWAFNAIHEDYRYLNNYKMTKEEYEIGKDLYKLYVFCLNFMPGILSIFYGDERGITGLGNLLNRQPIKWEKCDLELLKFIMMLGKIRKDNKFLKTADFNLIDINRNYLMFERESKLGSMLVTINKNLDEEKIMVPSKYEKYDKVYTLNRCKKNILGPHSGQAILKR